MESFKIEYFKKDNPTKNFPNFSTLTSDEAHEIYTRLSREMEGGLPPDQLVKKINEIGVPVDDYSAESDNFILKEVFDKLWLQPVSEVYINWYHFDNIDKISLKDLSNNFNDIWYPASDDIDIFDTTLSWILSINHEGSIKIVRLLGNNGAIKL